MAAGSNLSYPRNSRGLRKELKRCLNEGRSYRSTDEPYGGGGGSFNFGRGRLCTALDRAAPEDGEADDRPHAIGDICVVMDASTSKATEAHIAVSGTLPGSCNWIKMDD